MQGLYQLAKYSKLVTFTAVVESSHSEAIFTNTVEASNSIEAQTVIAT